MLLIRTNLRVRYSAPYWPTARFTVRTIRMDRQTVNARLINMSLMRRNLRVVLSSIRTDCKVYGPYYPYGSTNRICPLYSTWKYPKSHWWDAIHGSYSALYGPSTVHTIRTGRKRQTVCARSDHHENISRTVICISRTVFCSIRTDCKVNGPWNVTY